MQFLRNLVIGAVLLVAAAVPALAQTIKVDTPVKIALHVQSSRLQPDAKTDQRVVGQRRSADLAFPARGGHAG